MAESFITEAAMAVLTTVLSRAAEELKLGFNFNFKNHLKELDKKLKMIHMLLCGAADKSFHNPLVDDWLSKVKNVAYDANDLLDELAYEALKQRLEFKNRSQFTKRVLFFFTLHSNPVVFSFQMDHKVKYLMGCIEDVFKDGQTLGIKPVDLAAGPSRSLPVLEDVQLQVQRELVAGRGLIGRDQDEANIINMLCHPGNVDRDVNVVGIVGMAGLGKTALCKRAFDRDEVKRYFENRIWVCVSHDFEMKEILEKMLELLDGETSKKSSYQATIAKLETKLRGKRYLLVLDDVWDTILTVWESFTSILLDIGGLNGTVVLATSRSSQVITSMKINSEYQASTTHNGPLIYQLKGLKFIDSWSLFKQRVHTIIDVDRAEQMVASCRGIPLAINVLGNLLRNQCLEEWKEIEKSELWKLEDKNGILPSLRLSFNYLPSAAVKNCFAYCAVFPEDTIIEREPLILLWMAQDFLQPYDRMEHIGNEYFNILLNNSFFQDVVLDKHGKIESCKMHDVVHALAKDVMGQECLRLSRNIDMANVSSDVRHISVLTEKALALKLKKLRTLIYESLYTGIPNNLLVHAKCLRVLILVDAGLSELPISVGYFKHLRYLDISENDILKLPPAVGKLYNLQTLRHQNSSFRYQSTYPILPKELCNLAKLRHIYINNELYADSSFTVSLEAKRSALRRLDNDKWGKRIGDISFLNDIRGSLAIWNLEHVLSNEEARQASLRSKANIHRLDLTWSYNATCITDDSEAVLNELQPHEYLKALTIWYYNGKLLPSWLMDIRPSKVSQLPNLVEMKIYYCCNLQKLPASLLFPYLKILVVWGCSNLTAFPEFDSLRSLEILQVGRCPLLEGLPNVEPLTSLCRLEVHNCQRMTNLPLGLVNLCNLTELQIGPLCPELNYFPFPDVSGSCPLSKSLQNLCLIGWSNVGNIPDQLEHFSRLQVLTICRFRSVISLPSWLGNLTCLEIIVLQHMENLICLPPRNVMQLATKFRGFRTKPFHCPKLHIYQDIRPDICT